MTETKITYIIETRTNDGNWLLSDYTINNQEIDDIDKARLLIKQARDHNQICIRAVPRLKLENREYRLVKQTYSITTEVVDE